MTKLKLPRDFNALTMVGRKSGPFKDQRAGRGGAANVQHSLLSEYEEDSLEREDTQEDGKKERS